MVLYQIPVDPVESAVTEGQRTFGWAYKEGPSKDLNDEICLELYKEYTTSVCARVDMKKCKTWLDSLNVNKDGCCFLIEGGKVKWSHLSPEKHLIRQKMGSAHETRLNPPASHFPQLGSTTKTYSICC